MPFLNLRVGGDGDEEKNLAAKHPPLLFFSFFLLLWGKLGFMRGNVLHRIAIIFTHAHRRVVMVTR